MKTLWKSLAPVIAAILVALIPAPEGLAQHTRFYFANFTGAAPEVLSSHGLR